MGYTTSFVGQLYFNQELKASEIRYLLNYLDDGVHSIKDVRDMKDPPSYPVNFYFIDLKFNDNFTAIEWNGAEKTYSMEEQVKFIIEKMRECNEELILEGRLDAQGEEVGDVWSLYVNTNEVSTGPFQGTALAKKECSHCGGSLDD